MSYALGGLFPEIKDFLGAWGVANLLNLLFFIDAFVNQSQKKITVRLTILAIATYSTTGIVGGTISCFFWPK